MDVADISNVFRQLMRRCNCCYCSCVCVYSDLSGTWLVSDKPVAVFSGNNDASDGLLPRAGHLVEQLPPVDYWAYTFYLFNLPGISQYTYKMVTATAPNDVKLRTPSTTLPSQQLTHSGDLYTSSADRPLVIRASQPLLVAQFGGDSEPLPGNGPRAMLTVPPAELFRPWYTLATGHSDYDNFTHYLILVANRSAVDRLTLDGRPVGADNWTEFDSSGQDATVGRVERVQPGVHVIVQLDGTPFGAYVYGHSESNCAYAFTAGLCLGSPNNLVLNFVCKPFGGLDDNMRFEPLLVTTNRGSKPVTSRLWQEYKKRKNQKYAKNRSLCRLPSHRPTSNCAYGVVSGISSLVLSFRKIG